MLRSYKWDGYGWDGLGWDLCAGLFYEHRFAMLIRMSRFQFAATRGFAGARVVLKDQVQKGSQSCPLSFTRLMAHIGTVLTEKDWLSVARFAPIQTAFPVLVALGKCAVSIEISANCPPVIA